MNKDKLKTAYKALAAAVFAAVFAVLALSCGPADKPKSAGTIEFHFIDVGEADACLVMTDGHAMLVDGGNADDSSLIYSYLRDHSVTHLDYVICTHPHEDHVGGLSGALNLATVGRVFCPEPNEGIRAYASFVKTAEKRGAAVETLAAGDTLYLGEAKIDVLAPLAVTGDLNNDSYVLLITYGGTRFLLAGDMEAEEEAALLDSGADLDCDVLKVAHHGSGGSTSAEFLEKASPEYAVISVGLYNDHGHPSERCLERLKAAGAKILRTDVSGHIVISSDGERLTVTTGRGGTMTGGDPDYILNAWSKVFHRPDCESVGKMSERNRIEFYGTREEAIEQGYKPCGICRP
ncbi:MAG: MBL fold metallo-hydrolase [Clostridia bacterium]|nr:MBL fold metallo-hydrolase [Clostridia bacterium]